jgi:hypothetical protein
MLFPVFAAKVGKNWESFAQLPSGRHAAFRELPLPIYLSWIFG